MLKRVLEGMSVREVLDEVDDYLRTASTSNSVDLWTILSALRGPDDDLVDDADELKAKTTAVIRREALPYSVNFTWPQADDEATLDTAMKAAEDSGFAYHFKRHVEQAILALERAK